MKASFTIARVPQTLWHILATLCWAGLTPDIPLHAQSPPERMTYQGFLVGNDGTPLANSAPKNYDLVFRIFDEETGGSPLWGEQQTATVDKGYFSVLLGEGTAISGAGHDNLSVLFKGAGSSTRYVSISIAGVDTIQPRLRFLTSPYSFLAERSRKLVSDTGIDLITTSGNQLSFGGNLTALTLTATNFTGNGAAITNINANNISSGTLAAGRIPNLNADKINAGTFGAGRIPNLDADKITTGVLDADRIPDLNADKITSGNIGVNRIPNLDASKITTGTLDNDRLNTNVAIESQDNSFATLTVSKILAEKGSPATTAKGYSFSGDTDSGYFGRDQGELAMFCNNELVMQLSQVQRMQLFGLGSGNGTALEIMSDGKVVKNSSSKRYKTNIVKLEEDFTRILDAQPKRYSRLESTNATEIGYIAEDLHALGLTNLVYYDTEGKAESIHYAKISLYLNEVAKAQQREITELKSASIKQAETIAQQEAELKAMRSRFSELETLVQQVVALREPDPKRTAAVGAR